MTDDEIGKAMHQLGRNCGDKLNETILRIVRDSWPNPAACGGPFRCGDGMCGADDCLRCHPKPWSSHEESHTESDA